MGISKVEQQRVSLLLGNQDAASVEKTYQGLIIDEFGESLTDKFNKICIYAGLNLKNRNIFLLRVAFWTGLALVVLLASGEWLYGILACTPLYFEWSGLKKRREKEPVCSSKIIAPSCFQSLLPLKAVQTRSWLYLKP